MDPEPDDMEYHVRLYNMPHLTPAEIEVLNIEVTAFVKRFVDNRKKPEKFNEAQFLKDVHIKL